MKKKKMAAMVLTAAATLSLSIPAYAGQWMKNTTGWWYDYGNGSWPASSWQWIDGNNDGVAECYYFDRNGYLLTNTTTEDGYTVNGDGAWVKDNSVQTRSTAGTPTQEETKKETAKVNLLDLKPADDWLFWTYKSMRTNKNALWSEGFTLDSSFADTYVEYYVGGEYNTLTFEYSPKEGASRNLDSIVEVYGDDDNLLWSSDTIGYKSSAQKAEVDISGQEYIKINLHNEERFVITGSERQIIFKNGMVY